MKHLSIFFTLLFLLLISSSIAQTQWTKYTDPVLEHGPAGAWDEDLVAFPSVLHDGDMYHMWYANYNDTPAHIGYASSPDGITWTKYDNPETTDPLYAESDPVLMPGATGTYDDEGVVSPTVLLIADTYHMWYAGNNTGIAPGRWEICHATSADGIIWIKDSNNPVVKLGPQTWDSYWMVEPNVVFDGDQYHMWYCAWDGNFSTDRVRIGHATAVHPDSTWTKDANNPILTGYYNAWDYRRLDAPSVIYDGSRFHMWYSGGYTFNWRIGYAFSDDGSTWQKYIDNPVMGTSAGTFCKQSVSHCSVIRDEETGLYKMWYLGASSSIKGAIGYATAPALLSVPADYATIQAAINAAKDGNVVLVDEGTYYENINFEGKAISVASNFYLDGDTSHISKTIIDGSQSTNPDSGSVVYFISGEDTTSVLSGLTITGGTGTFATLWDDVFRAGGGIFCSSVSGAKIVNNRITENHITEDNVTGGGLLFDSDNGILVLENNHIFNNHLSANKEFGVGGGAEISGAGVYARIIKNIIEGNTVISEGWAVSAGAELFGKDQLASAIIEGNVFRENIADAKINGGLAGGLYCYGTSVVQIRDNIFENNIAKSRDAHGEGGALIIDDTDKIGFGRKIVSGNRFINNLAKTKSGIWGRGGAIEIFNTLANVSGNYFEQNTAEGGSSGGGAIRTWQSGFRIENNIFNKNTARRGGAFRIAGRPASDSGMEIINNTIVGNKALSYGGGLYIENANVVIINSIIWSNLPQQLSSTNGQFDVRYTDIQGDWEGEGNFDVDPMFEEGTFELSKNSYCIAAGRETVTINNVDYNAPTTCYLGRERPLPVGSAPDLGACESFLGVDIEVVESITPEEFALEQNYPNPFNPRTTIEYQLPKLSQVDLGIYNLLGQKVATLVSEKQPVGSYKANWDGSGFSSGVYFYKLETDQGFTKTKKLVVLK